MDRGSKFVLRIRSSTPLSPTSLPGGFVTRDYLIRLYVEALVATTGVEESRIRIPPQELVGDNGDLTVETEIISKRGQPSAKGIVVKFVDQVNENQKGSAWRFTKFYETCQKSGLQVLVTDFEAPIRTPDLTSSGFGVIGDMREVCDFADEDDDLPDVAPLHFFSLGGYGIPFPPPDHNFYNLLEREVAIPHTYPTNVFGSGIHVPLPQQHPERETVAPIRSPEGVVDAPGDKDGLGEVPSPIVEETISRHIVAPSPIQEVPVTECNIGAISKFPDRFEIPIISQSGLEKESARSGVVGDPVKLVLSIVSAKDLPRAYEDERLRPFCTFVWEHKKKATSVRDGPEPNWDEKFQLECLVSRPSRSVPKVALRFV
eukprot:GHVN01050759.1.p1 GENE.GHVN01050759.1~~GHVN01050759.1.p1  ORF type:complete len:373 (+),score=43.99 GHVN01050759.1:116-1234(+)